MSSQAALLKVKQAALSPESDLWRHAAVRPVTDHEAPLAERRAPTVNGHDFSQVPAQGQSTACPLAPRRCPFGGACHTCPAHVQAKLAINQPGDEYEEEADRVAETVMRRSGPQVHARTTPEEPEGLEEEASISAEALPDDESESETGGSAVAEEEAKIQRLTAGITLKRRSSESLSRLPAWIETDLSRPLAGVSLPEGAKVPMERALNRDFSGVRVHTGSLADLMCAGLGAEAFTLRSDVYFARGRFNPSTPEGQRLLAHELVHVVQQAGPGTTASAGRVQRRIAVAGKELGRRAARKFVEAKLKKHPAIKAKVLKILSAMLDPLTQSLTFDSMDDLHEYMLRRYWLVKGMGVVGAGRCCGYARPSPPYYPQVNHAAKDYWKHVKDFQFELTPLGKGAADSAVAKLFTPQAAKKRRTLIDCTHIITALHYFSLMMSVGKKAFRNRVASGQMTVKIVPWNEEAMLGKHVELGEIGQVPLGQELAVPESSGIITAFRPADISELIPGDHVYFANHPTYAPLIRELRKRRAINACPKLTGKEKSTCQDIWAGEHAVYLGVQGNKYLFQGHGTGRVSMEEMVNRMLVHYNCHVKQAMRCTPPLASVAGQTLKELKKPSDVPGLINLAIRPKIVQSPKAVGPK